MTMRWQVVIAAVLMGLGSESSALLRAQSFLDLANPLSSNPQGFHLYSASASVLYSSYALSGVSLPGGVGTRNHSETGLSGNINFGWTKHSERSDLALNYSPSYFAYPQYTWANTSNHAITLTWRRKISSRWDLNMVLGSNISSLNQVVFGPNGAGNLGSLSATFDSLGGGGGNQQLSSLQTGSFLSGPSPTDSAAMALFYGSRVLSSSVQIDFSYHYSPRLSFHFGSSAMRTQNLRDSKEIQSNYWIGHSTGVTSSAGLSYSLSPRTNLSANLSSTRDFSVLQDAYNNEASLSIKRMMGPRWFVQAEAGVGLMVAVRRTYNIPTSPQFEGGGGVGIQTRSQGLLVSFERRVGDQFGLGASSSSMVRAGWSWHRPGWKWAFSVNGGGERLTSVGLQNINSWQVMGGVTRALGAHLGVAVQYGYLNYSMASTTALAPGQGAARVSILWTPRVMVR